MNIIKKTSTYLFLFILLSLSPQSFAQNNSEIQLLIKHAETYYWFGVAEKGNMEAFKNALYYLEIAENHLTGSNLTAKTENKILLQISKLRKDIEEQMDMAHDTFYGVFPIVRFSTNPIFRKVTAYKTFELIDDPDIIAVTSAAEELASSIANSWRKNIQLNTFFASVPHSEAYENEVRYIFNNYPKFYVYNANTLYSILDSADINELSGDTLSTKLTKKIRHKTNSDDFLIVKIKQVDIIDGNYFFQVEGRIFSSGNSLPSQSSYKMGFARDKRSQSSYIIFANIGFLVLAVFIFSILSYFQKNKFPPLMEIAVSVLFPFLTGRILPWILIPLLLPLKPEPENLAILSFWWAALTALVLYFVPLIVVRNLSLRIKGLNKFFDFNGKGGIIFVVANLGVCAFFSESYFLFYEIKGLQILILTSLITSIIAYIVGRALDKIDPFPKYPAIIGVLFMLPTGVAMMQENTIYLWISLIVTFALLFFVLFKRKEKNIDLTKVESRLSKSVEGDNEPIDIISACENPSYYKFDYYDEIYKEVESLFQNKVVWISLTGNEGTGKTATAEAIIEDIRQRAIENKIVVNYLFGKCPENNSSANPYAPFKEALIDYFGVNVFGSEDEQLSHIDSALDGIFETFIPFSGLLFPPKDNEANVVQSENQIVSSISRTIKKLSSKNPLILFIDDIHWIDDSSKRLLLYLEKEIPHGSPGNLMVILTGRELKDIQELIKIGVTHRLKKLTHSQLLSILNRNLKLKKEVEDFIIQQVGDGFEIKGNLFWLYQTIRNLAILNAFEFIRGEYVWSEKFRSLKKLPIPNDLKETIKEQLNKFPEYREILECAACLGLEFNANTLAESIELTRLKCLRLLNSIEENTGFIYDVTVRDDIYSFRSSFYLEVIRDELKIEEHGPLSNDVPQLVREYHARIAKSLEKKLKNTSSDLYKVAKHYYAAGTAYSKKATQYCLKSANSCIAIYQFDEARKFIEMARECANSSGDYKKWELDILLIECDIVHFEGKDSDIVVEKCLEYYGKHRDFPIIALIYFARLFYQARQYNKAVELGNRIIDESKNNINKAEGFHFVGVSKGRLKDDGYKQLISAKELLKGEKSAKAQKLLSRINDSLASELVKHNRFSEAKKIYEESISIKEKYDDKKGLAISYGGIGRLFLNYNPPDFKNARQYFEKDLNCSIEIGDIGGQIIMNSHLGYCDLLEEKYSDAIIHYQKSYDLSKSMGSKAFALVGLLEASIKLENYEKSIEAVNEIQDLMDKISIPDDFLVKLNDILKQIDAKENTDRINILKNKLEFILK